MSTAPAVCPGCNGDRYFDASGPGHGNAIDTVIIDGFRAQVCTDCDGEGVLLCCDCGKPRTDLSIKRCDRCLAAHASRRRRLFAAAAATLCILIAGCGDNYTPEPDASPDAAVRVDADPCIAWCAQTSLDVPEFDLCIKTRCKGA